MQWIIVFIIMAENNDCMSSSMSEDDALKLLDIKKGSSLEEINGAFRKAVTKAHPDHGGNPDTFKKVTMAKEKLVAVFQNNHQPISMESVAEREKVNVIVLDDAFFVLEHEQEFRAWRTPNLKIMNRLTANNRNKETELVLAYCGSGRGATTQAIEEFLRVDAGISSPYHMHDRVMAIKMIIDAFKEHMKSK